MVAEIAGTRPTVLHLPPRQAQQARERLVEQIRDGVMQDLVAVGILVGAIRSQLAAEEADVTADSALHDVLTDISATLDGDVEHLRAVLQELNAA